jgi:hypothetical protein
VVRTVSDQVRSSSKRREGMETFKGNERTGQTVKTDEQILEARVHQVPQEKWAQPVGFSFMDMGEFGEQNRAMYDLSRDI